MKKRKFVKIFTISLCLSSIFSVTALANDYKEVKQYKPTRIIKCAVAPLPSETEFPE